MAGQAAWYRTFLKVPGFFGAPFGFSLGRTQHLVVSIRGLSWQGDEVTLPPAAVLWRAAPSITNGASCA